MATLQEFKTAINNANTKVAAKVKGKAAEAFLADDSKLLGGWSKDQYVAAAVGPITAHANDKNNPHNVTAATLGAYTKVEIDELIAKRIPGAFLPLSRFGVLSETGSDDVPPETGGVPWSSGVPPKVRIGATKILMNGSAFTMPETYVTMPTVGSVNIYLRLVAGVPEYFPSPLAIPDSPRYMCIGSGYADTGRTTPTISLRAVTRLGNYRVSTLAVGSSISVSQGFAGAPANLAWT